MQDGIAVCPAMSARGKMALATLALFRSFLTPPVWRRGEMQGLKVWFPRQHRTGTRGARGGALTCGPCAPTLPARIPRPLPPATASLATREPAGLATSSAAAGWAPRSAVNPTGWDHASGRQPSSTLHVTQSNAFQPVFSSRVIEFAFYCWRQV